jgi:hypothetical protein
MIALQYAIRKTALRARTHFDHAACSYSVAQAHHPFYLGAMVAAEEGAFLFESVTDNMNAAIPASRGQRMVTEDFINVYGNYAIKLLRLQNDMIQTFERYRRGNKQTVEVRHVHIHPGGQGVVGIINPPEDRDAGVRE